MLKHFYKTLLIALISGSLVSMHSSVAFADGKVVDEKTTQNNGIISNVKKYKFEKISDSDMLVSIIMLAGGVITGRMLQSYTPVTMDVKIAGAAGVAFVAGELISNVKFKGKMDAMTAEVERKSDGKINEEQIQRLKDLKKSYEEARNTTSTKKKMQLAAAVGFGAAAIASTYMAMKEKPLEAQCQAALVSAAATLSACTASSVFNTDSPSCADCAKILSKYAIAYNKFTVTRVIPGLSIAKIADATPSVTFLTNPASYCAVLPAVTTTTVATKIASTCVASVVEETKAQQSAKVAASNTNLMKSILNIPVVTENLSKQPLKKLSIVEKILNFLLPTASAGGWIPLLGLAGSTAIAFFAITPIVGVQLDTLMFVPSNRAIAFGLFAGLSYIAAKSSENVIEKLDSNIKSIDEILESLDRLANGVKAQNVAYQQVKMQFATPNNGVVELFSKDGSTRTPCMTSNNTSNCAALDTQLSNLPGFSGLPDSFKSVASQTVKLGDALSGVNGITGSTLASAESLGAKQAAIAGLLSKKESELDKLMRGNSSTQKEQDKFLAGMAAKVKKDLENRGMTAGGFMASVGGTVLDSSVKKSEKSTTDMSTKTTSLNGVGMGGAGAPTEKISLDFDDNSSKQEITLNEAGGGKASAPEYEIKENEINGEHGPSIFELISGRYIKSGYSKLLEEEPSKN